MSRAPRLSRAYHSEALAEVGEAKANRRHPKTKGKTVLGAQHRSFPDQLLGYVDSRKKVYVPDYYKHIEHGARLGDHRASLATGRDIVVFDFDGPRDESGQPLCKELTLDLLKEKIGDTTVPFGHGYVVAAAIAGIAPDEYCMERESVCVQGRTHP